MVRRQPPPTKAGPPRVSVASPDFPRSIALHPLRASGPCFPVPFSRKGFSLPLVKFSTPLQTKSNSIVHWSHPQPPCSPPNGLEAPLRGPLHLCPAANHTVQLLF